MKNKHLCPKCGGNDILRFDGFTGAYGAGNNVMVGKSVFSAVNVNRYVCCGCGYTEEWIDLEDMEQIKASKKTQKIGD